METINQVVNLSNQYKDPKDAQNGLLLVIELESVKNTAMITIINDIKSNHNIKVSIIRVLTNDLGNLLN